MLARQSREHATQFQGASAASITRPPPSKEASQVIGPVSLILVEMSDGNDQDLIASELVNHAVKILNETKRG